jgi:hypothetical protein
MPIYLSASGAVREPEGNRAALGLAPYCYTALPPFLFPVNRHCIHFSPIKTKCKGQE